jgi:hypothetical protein
MEGLGDIHHHDPADAQYTQVLADDTIGIFAAEVFDEALVKDKIERAILEGEAESIPPHKGDARVAPQSCTALGEGGRGVIEEYRADAQFELERSRATDSAPHLEGARAAPVADLAYDALDALVLRVKIRRVAAARPKPIPNVHAERR